MQRVDKNNSKEWTFRDFAAMAIVFFSALGLSNAVDIFLLNEIPLLGDAKDYADRAVELRGGVDNGKAHYWPPGVPYVIVAIYYLTGSLDFTMVQTLVSLISSLTTSILYSISRLAGLGFRWAILSSIIYSLSPTVILLSRQSESHVFCAFWIVILVLASMLYAKRRSLLTLIACCAAVSMLVLTRPGSFLLMIGLWLWPVLVFMNALKKKEVAFKEEWGKVLAHVLLTIALGAAFLWPTLKFNYDRGAGWVLSTNNERNFFLGNNPYTHQYKTGHQAWRKLDELPEDSRLYLAQHYAAELPRDEMLKSALKYIVDEPWKFFARCINRFLNFWAFDYEQGRRTHIHLSEQGVGGIGWVVLGLQAVYSVTVLWIMFIGLPALWGSELRLWLIVLLIMIFMYQAPHILAFSSPVYRVGIFPVLVLLGVSGLSRLSSYINENFDYGSRKIYIVFYISCLTLAILLVNVQAAYFLIALK